ncbi:MAG: hypothetical protein A3D38_01720 [Candidatus Portnoybacteria bacterium RIFCSPHIGHO2_02_FULL_40_23]|nr:MAG: hypothetical protein A3D38_01720 [Candidatus Portnoybacteria bacterium RIFCSPHIGHO2_02_FULL_40_23]
MDLKIPTPPNQTNEPEKKPIQPVIRTMQKDIKRLSGYAPPPTNLPLPPLPKSLEGIQKKFVVNKNDEQKQSWIQKEQEERKKQEEGARKEAEKRKEREEKIRRKAEKLARKAEEARKEAEEEARKAEEARKEAEEEARKAEEARKEAEEEARKTEEAIKEEKIKKETEEKRKEELEEKRRKEEGARKEAEKRIKEEKLRKKIEEKEKKKAEKQARKDEKKRLKVLKKQTRGNRSKFTFIILVIILGSAGFFYWWNYIHSPELIEPASLIPIDETKIIEIQAGEESLVLEKIKTAANQTQTIGARKRILIKLTDGEKRYASLTELVLALNINIPEDILSSLENYSLFLYSQEQGQRLGLVVKTSKDIKENLTAWENTMTENIKPLLLGIETGAPATQEFQDNIYQNTAIRYLNFADSSLAIDYALVSDKLIITFSKESVYAAVDALLTVK